MMGHKEIADWVLEENLLTDLKESPKKSLLIKQLIKSCAGSNKDSVKNSYNKIIKYLYKQS
ncbi:MAG: hypothetical protein ABIA63_13130 [bacterium]